MTLIELSVTAGLVGVLGLIIYSLIEHRHHSGRQEHSREYRASAGPGCHVANDCRICTSAISLPYLVDVDSSGTPVLDPIYPGSSPCWHNRAGRRTGSGHCLPAMVKGPLKIIADTAALPGSQNFVKICLPNSASPLPVVYQRVIIPTHQIEGDITAVTGAWNNLTHHTR